MVIGLISDISNKFDKFFEYKKIFWALIRRILDYFCYAYPNVLKYLRNKLINARYNFTVERLKWEESQVLVYISTDLHIHLISKGIYEKNETDFIKNILKKGDVFIDVGAHVGLYSILAGNLVGSSGQVISFEPSNREYKLLIRNIKLNKLTNIRAYKVALSNYNGRANILISGAFQTAENTLSEKFRCSVINLDHTENVIVRKLDDLISINRLNKLTAIKIDAEGHDFFILEGAKDIITYFKPIIMVENSEDHLKNAGCSSKQMHELLEGLQYKIFYFDENGKLTQKQPQYIYSPNIVCFP